MSVHHATQNAELHRLHADVSVALNHCHREGQISRGLLLAQARELLQKAIAAPVTDERELSLEMEGV